MKPFEVVIAGERPYLDVGEVVAQSPECNQMKTALYMRFMEVEGATPAGAKSRAEAAVQNFVEAAVSEFGTGWAESMRGELELLTSNRLKVESFFNALLDPEAPIPSVEEIKPKIAELRASMKKLSIPLEESANAYKPGDSLKNLLEYEMTPDKAGEPTPGAEETPKAETTPSDAAAQPSPETDPLATLEASNAPVPQPRSFREAMGKWARGRCSEVSGQIGEAIARIYLEDLVGTFMVEEVEVQIGQRSMRIDFVVRGPNGERLGFEVKFNKAGLKRDQRAVIGLSSTNPLTVKPVSTIAGRSTVPVQGSGPRQVLLEPGKAYSIPIRVLRIPKEVVRLIQLFVENPERFRE